ncbi:MAG: hypothetical protein QTN59_00120 [Candidatus Electrothrix communis]|nr:MAG: hypothetical protein QTN59_00120 [Candidatus Electrothrix communis]
MSDSPVQKYNTLTVTQVHSNVDQEVIEITEDKLSLILKDYVQDISSRKEWVSPFSVLLTIAILQCTANFKDRFGIPADTWNALFIFTGMASLIWLIIVLVKMKKAVSIDELLKTIKNIE